MLPRTIILFLCLSVCLFADLFIDPQVVNLTPENFFNITGLPTPKGNQTANATSNWFIIFYSPYCPHCHKAMPSWNQLAKNVKEIPTQKPTKIAAVDCVAHNQLCAQFVVRGYPTMTLLTVNNTQKQFSGDRSVESYRKFMSQIYAGELKTGLVGQPEDEGTLRSIKEFFQNLTWAGMLMIILMVVLVGMLIYVLFDREEEGKDFTQIRAADREIREISSAEL